MLQAPARHNNMASTGECNRATKPHGRRKQGNMRKIVTGCSAGTLSIAPPGEVRPETSEALHHVQNTYGTGCPQSTTTQQSTHRHTRAHHVGTSNHKLDATDVNLVARSKQDLRQVAKTEHVEVEADRAPASLPSCGGTCEAGGWLAAMGLCTRHVEAPGSTSRLCRQRLTLAHTIPFGEEQRGATNSD